MLNRKLNRKQDIHKRRQIFQRIEQSSHVLNIANLINMNEFDKYV